MVHPILEYGSSVCDPYTDKLREELEKVKKRATRNVTRNYVYETGGMTGILGQLKWESLRKRRKDNRVILLYKGLKGKARIPTDDHIPRLDVAEISTPWPFRYPLPVKISIIKAFSPRLSGTGMTSLNP